MQLNAITHADQAVSTIRSSLRDVEFWMHDIPVVFRGDWKSGIGSAIHHVTRDSIRAVHTLDAAGIAPAAVDDIRRAMEHLGDSPLRGRPVRRSLDRVAASLDGFRAEAAAPLDSARAVRADLIAPARSIIVDELAASTAPDSRARLAAALRFDGQLDDAASILAHDELLASLPVDARRTLALDMVSRPAADLSRPELRLLLRLVENNASGGVIDMHGPAGSPHLADWMHWSLRHVLEGDRRADLRHVERHFAAQRVANQDLTTRAAQADAIWASDPRTLDQRDWAALEAILTQDARPAHLGFVTDLPPLPRLGGLIHGAQFGAIDHRMLEQYFQANATRGWDAAARLQQAAVRIGDAVQAFSRGSSDALRLGVRATEHDLLAQHVRTLPIADQARFAHALLRDADGSDLAILPLGLDITRRELLARRLPDSLVELRDQTVRLVDANSERLAGRTPDGMVRGYSNHPEYAELGRIHSNVQLIGAFDERANVPTDVATLSW